MALPHNTYPYILFHCERAKYDGHLNEPILERGMITLVCGMGNIFKIEFYWCPDPLEVRFLLFLYYIILYYIIFLDKSAKSKGSGHE